MQYIRTYFIHHEMASNLKPDDKSFSNLPRRSDSLCDINNPTEIKIIWRIIYAVSRIGFITYLNDSSKRYLNGRCSPRLSHEWYWENTRNGIDIRITATIRFGYFGPSVDPDKSSVTSVPEPN